MLQRRVLKLDEKGRKTETVRDHVNDKDKKGKRKEI
jgi:hypothetical protein